MASDRFIRFDGDTPAHDKVGLLIEDFLGSVGSVEWADDISRFMVGLPGKPSDPRRRAVPEYAHHDDVYVYGHARWIEVFVAPGEPIDVITRMGDPFVSGVADRLASVIAQALRGVNENEFDYKERAKNAEASLDKIRETFLCAKQCVGCGDNSCLFVKPKGMATNGGCRCVERGGGRPGVNTSLAALYKAVEVAVGGGNE